MANVRRIAINTGGGDAPGLNAVIEAATHAAHARGWELIGIQHTAPGQAYYIFKRELADGAEPDLSVVRNGIVREQPGGGEQPGSGAGPQVTAL